MINIHMLVWGAKHIGPVSDLRMDADPATTWMNMALAHARQVRCNTTRAGARQQAHWDQQQWQRDDDHKGLHMCTVVGACTMCAVC